MTIDPTLAMFALGQCAVAAGIYAAIRADIREAILTSQYAKESADSAHKRIDDIS